MTVFKGSPLGELARIRNVTTRRVSSWDRTGSTAYWYQLEPHKPFPALPPVADRLPRPD